MPRYTIYNMLLQPSGPMSATIANKDKLGLLEMLAGTRFLVRRQLRFIKQVEEKINPTLHPNFAAELAYVREHAKTDLASRDREVLSEPELRETLSRMVLDHDALVLIIRHLETISPPALYQPLVDQLNVRKG